ncbi:unnamed protein product [Triticum turgidum subsp. durum]|uniref:Uncharacterized protein n=1 Tax=Triticum turgidum subsp. durum TaxID=4567 RepID=A0A9R0Y835_TRITD|nr:unnamed protein product [Triticum turgidum subsp. durum]
MRTVMDLMIARGLDKRYWCDISSPLVCRDDLLCKVVLTTKYKCNVNGTVFLSVKHRVQYRGTQTYAVTPPLSLTLMYYVL